MGIFSRILSKLGFGDDKEDAVAAATAPTPGPAATATSTATLAPKPVAVSQVDVVAKLATLAAANAANAQAVRAASGVKELVHAHVLNDFAKSERPWVDAMIDAIAGNVTLLVEGKDASFANKVHLAMQAKGFASNADNGDNGG